MSTTTFATARATIRYLRGTLPTYHDVMQRGGTQLLALYYWPELPDVLPDAATLDELLPGASGFRMNDDELWTSDTTVLMVPLFLTPDVELSPEESTPDVLFSARLVIRRTRMRDGGGTLRWVNEQASMTVHETTQLGFGDSIPVQSLAFHYCGPPSLPGSAHAFPSVYQVQAATGSWATATNVLVVPGPPGWRKLFVSRTMNEQAAAENLPALPL